MDDTTILEMSLYEALFFSCSPEAEELQEAIKLTLKKKGYIN